MVAPHAALLERERTHRVEPVLCQESRSRGARLPLRSNLPSIRVRGTGWVGPVFGSLVRVDSGKLRHGISQIGSWAPADVFFTSGSGIDVAVQIPESRGLSPDVPLGLRRGGCAENRATRREGQHPFGTAPSGEYSMASAGSRERLGALSNKQLLLTPKK
jgi:hypothetical protein